MDLGYGLGEVAELHHFGGVVGLEVPHCHFLVVEGVWLVGELWGTVLTTLPRHRVPQPAPWQNQLTLLQLLIDPIRSQIRQIGLILRLAVLPRNRPAGEPPSENLGNIFILQREYLLELEKILPAERDLLTCDPHVAIGGHNILGYGERVESSG